MSDGAYDPQVSRRGLLKGIGAAGAASLGIGSTGQAGAESNGERIERDELTMWLTRWDEGVQAPFGLSVRYDDTDDDGEYDPALDHVTVYAVDGTDEQFSVDAQYDEPDWNEHGTAESTLLRKDVTDEGEYIVLEFVGEPQGDSNLYAVFDKDKAYQELDAGDSFKVTSDDFVRTTPRNGDGAALIEQTTDI